MAPVPDPSTAGELTSASLPQEFLGFVPEVRPPEEGEFSPNGTWVVATKASEAAAQTWPNCSGQPPAVGPEHVLMGLYADETGAKGVGQVFQFANDKAARDWFDAYAVELGACGPETFTEVVELKESDGVLASRRVVGGQPWGERAWRDGHLLSLIIIQREVDSAALLSAR